jgi:hypothetical protein
MERGLFPLTLYGHWPLKFKLLTLSPICIPKQSYRAQITANEHCSNFNMNSPAILKCKILHSSSDRCAKITVIFVHLRCQQYPTYISIYSYRSYASPKSSSCFNMKLLITQMTCIPWRLRTMHLQQRLGTHARMLTELHYHDSTLQPSFFISNLI